MQPLCIKTRMDPSQRNLQPGRTPTHDSAGPSSTGNAQTQTTNANTKTQPKTATTKVRATPCRLAVLPHCHPPWSRGVEPLTPRSMRPAAATTSTVVRTPKHRCCVPLGVHIEWASQTHGRVYQDFCCFSIPLSRGDALGLRSNLCTQGIPEECAMHLQLRRWHYSTVPLIGIASRMPKLMQVQSEHVLPGQSHRAGVDSRKGRGGWRQREVIEQWALGVPCLADKLSYVRTYDPSTWCPNGPSWGPGPPHTNGSWSQLMMSESPACCSLFRGQWRWVITCSPAKFIQGKTEKRPPSTLEE
jgi:hypothetical protein